MSLESHDKSLKFLLSQSPEDFIRFGLHAPALQVIRPVESDLPARDRQVDGAYVFQNGAHREVAHVEFHRRHENLIELGLDIGEVQLRLRRKERLPVYSLLWDLYGSRHAKVLEDRVVTIGRQEDTGCTRIVYRRVNLRGMGTEELLEKGPKAFYPLVPLAADGAEIAQVRKAMIAIEQRVELSPSQRADHLTVLHFLALSEDLPEKVLDSFMSKEKMMESSFYRSILNEGEAKGRVEGKAEGIASALIRLLVARLGNVSPEVRQLILVQSKTSPDTLSVWFDEAALATDAESALRLVRKISAI